MPSAEGSRRLATCSVNTFALNRLPFVIQSPMVLVLDRKSLEDGQIIGLLQEGDVLGASLLEFPWVMLPEGSFVRHPKMRQGRIKLLRSGWLISQHPQYGELMHALSMDLVRKLFSEEAFAKLPLVKEAAQAAQATSNRPVRLEDDLPMADGYPGAKSPPPKSVAEQRPSGAQPKALPEAIAKMPPPSAATAKPKVPESPARPTPKFVAPVLRPKDPDPAATAVAAAPTQMATPSSTPPSTSAAARQGRSEAQLVLGVPGRPWAPVAAPESRINGGPEVAPKSPTVTPKVAPKSPSVTPKVAPKSPTVTPKASSNGVSSTLAKMPKQTRASPEVCQRHLQMCSCEHWKVIHSFVFVRSDASLDSEPLAVLREGSLLCAAKPEEPRSSDGKWARLGSQAKVWADITSDRPDFVALGREGIYVLIHKADVGDLIRLIPSQASPEFQRQLSGSSRAIGAYEDLEKLDHWVVLKECRMVAKREEETPEDFLLEEGDVLRSVDHSMARIFRDGNIRWLHVPAGSQVFKAPDQLPALVGGLHRQAYVKLEVGEEIFLRRHKAIETGTSITELSSYGEPWVVEHEQVVVRRGPSMKDQPLGVMIKGDVVGVRRRQGDWLELVQDSEVRFKKRESPDQPITAVNPLRRHKEGKRSKKTSAHQIAWMLVEHPELGQLLRRARKRKGGLRNGCVLSPERLQMYQEVVELCHRRIYKENLESLWDGEAEKLPGLETIEAKLFEEEMEVLHVTQDGKFTGGALVKELSVKARHVEGSSNLNLAAPAHHHPGSSEILGTTTVGYIDSMASEAQTKSGQLMWDFITGMPFICLACHSILRQKTVDFWQARGMKHMDPSNEKDCTAFRQMVMVHTMGKVICELKDLQEALPKSKLPLFVYVPSRFTEEDESLHENYIFKPEEDEPIS